MPVIPVNKVGPKKNNWKTMEGQGGGEAQGVADPKKMDTHAIERGADFIKHFRPKFMDKT
jgi:hypothetical protein